MKNKCEDTIDIATTVVIRTAADATWNATDIATATASLIIPLPAYRHIVAAVNEAVWSINRIDIYLR